MIEQRWPAEDHPAFAARLLFAGAIGMLFTPGSLLFYAGGVFVLAIGRETGWDRQTLTSAIGITSLILGFMSPITGYLVDRFKSRRVLMVAMPAQGLGLVMLGLLPQSAASFFAVACLAALLASGQLPHAYTLSISSWFDRRRGIALGSVLAFTGVGIAIVAPTAAALIDDFGWRMTYVIMGLGTGIIGFFCSSLLVADPPVGNRIIEAHLGLTWREALGTRRFWAIFVAFFFVAASVGAGIVHLPIMLSDRGASTAVAAAAVSVVGAGMVIARIAFGYFLDRIFAPYLAGIIFLAVGCGHLAVFAGGHATLVGAALLGIGLGAEVDAAAYMVGRAFGFRNFGQIFGIFFMAIGFGGAVGPSAMGWAVGAGGQYDIALIWAALAAFVGAISIFLVQQKDLPYRSHHKEKTSEVLA